jgi:hypothetical protein
MPKKLPLLNGEISLSTALTEEVNMLRRLELPGLKKRFFADVDGRRSWIKSVVAHHLGLQSPDQCKVAEVEDWRHGSFNLCVPVTIHPWNEREQLGQRVMLRLPLPYSNGEAFAPGNGDEKIRCEAGTYVWLQENCPDVPIPRLYGFGTSTGETVSPVYSLA